MKNILIILLSVVSFTGNAAGTLDDHVQWNYEKEVLGDILKDIEQTEQVTFTYGNVKLNEKITIRFDGTLADGLHQLFSPQNIEYKIIGDHIALKYAEVKGKDVKGRVLDADSRTPLIGASLIIVGSDPLVGTITDEEGYFRMEALTVGRYDLRVDYIGYESYVVPQVLVTTGKEVFLNIDLTESTLELAEIVVTATSDKTQALNEMATISARSFSVEESKRYAAAVSDPARMAQSYAGVSSGGDDLSNEIIIRGNSARGLLWRLEGIDIPSPNHFGDLGSGGGNISMLSASTLSNSDFYTGAFPAEFGNALSGVFDLRMRNGNSDEREYSIMFGNLGLEVATEGYFKKESNASYLVNYRFSTLGFMGKFLPSLKGAIPAYQDLSFKINIPTEKAGVFGVIGLGGVSTDDYEADADSSLWYDGGDDISYREKSRLGVIGLTHKYLFSNEKTYLRSSLSGSAYTYDDTYERLIPEDNYMPSVYDETHFKDYILSASMVLNHKFNSQHHIRSGATLSEKLYKYRYDTTEPEGAISFFRNSGSALYLEGFTQWRYRFAEDWTLNTGVNFKYLFLNNTMGIDPRVALKWDFAANQSLAFAVGLHSKPEHTSTYLIERFVDDVAESPNRDLEMTKAVHVVLGYDIQFAGDFRFKAEAYYQFLYDVPVSLNQSSGFSILNTSGIFDVIFQNNENGGELVSAGTGVNYGIDLTLEKFFSKGYYFLVTASIFDSKYSTLNNEYYHTLYANNYIANVLGGKEFTVGKKQKNLLSLNAKFTYYDGRRSTPIDMAASEEAGYTIHTADAFYTRKLKPYYRFDVGIAYTVNAPRSTHSLMFDVQNITNRFNIYDEYYNERLNKISQIYQNGAIPIINYRVEF